MTDRAAYESGTGESGRGVPPVSSGQDAHATLDIRQGAYLPHWTMEGAAYSLTFRLADSLPQRVLGVWLSEREHIIRRATRAGRPLSRDEENRLNQLHSEKVERYLDAGHGSCWMKDDTIAEIGARALRHFDGDRYDLIAYCVMPNHVHAVIRPLEGHGLPGILHSWKSVTAKAANKPLGRRGAFWRQESYDHLIRDNEDLRHAVEYVLNNPANAGLTGWKWVWARGTGESGTGESGTGVPPVVRSMNAPPMVEQQDHGQDAHATVGPPAHGSTNRTRRGGGTR